MTEVDYDHLIQLEDALGLVYDAQAAVLKGKRANPSKEQQRALNKAWARLELEKADLEGQITAIEDEGEILPPPSAEMVTEIARLTAAAETETRKGKTAAEYLTFAGAVLAMATEVTAPA